MGSLHHDTEMNGSNGTRLSQEGVNVTDDDVIDIFSDSNPVASSDEHSNDLSADELSLFDMSPSPTTLSPSVTSLSPSVTPSSPTRHCKSPNNLDLSLGDLEPSADIFAEDFVIDSHADTAAKPADFDLPFPELSWGTPVAETFTDRSGAHDPFSSSALDQLLFGAGITMHDQTACDIL